MCQARGIVGGTIFPIGENSLTSEFAGADKMVPRNFLGSPKVSPLSGIDESGVSRNHDTQVTQLVDAGNLAGQDLFVDAGKMIGSR